MSVAVMGDVWKYSMASGNNLLLLLAMADHADDQGLCWPSILALAKKTRVSESTVKRSIKSLIRIGELRLVEAGGTFGTKRLANRYRILRGRREYEKEPTGGQIEPRPGFTAMTPTPGSQLRPPNRHKQPSEETTTKSASRFPATNCHSADPPVVVVVSFFVSEEDDPTDVLNKLSDKFGLSPEQEEMVLGHFNEKDGLGYVIEKAKMACLPGVKNPGAYFIKAIEKGWKPPRLSPGPPKHRKAEPLPIQVPLVSELSDEQRSHTLAEIKKLKATI